MTIMVEEKYKHPRTTETPVMWGLNCASPPKQGMEEMTLWKNME